MPVRNPPQPPLVINGTLTVGQTLTASRSYGPTTIQWQRGADPTWNDISGATGFSYTEVTADTGFEYRTREYSASGAARYSDPTSPLGGTARAAVVTWGQMTINPNQRAALVTFAYMEAPH